MSRTRPAAPPELRTAPVLAVVVCHDGEEWLPDVLAALRESNPRPRHVLAIDTGSVDGTWAILAEVATGPERLVDGVLTLPRDTGFGAAVATAVAHARHRWGDPGAWLWLLHDDSAPEADCLGTLLKVADLAPSAAVFGPLALDWADPRLVAEAGLSTDSSGHRHSGGQQTELDWGRYSARESNFDQDTEVLAVPSAGSLIRLVVWDELGGFDPAVPLFRDDLDFGWRANRAGHLVLFVPSARLRHARALTGGVRLADAAVALRQSGATDVARRDPHPLITRLAADRAHGVRTFLVNCSLLAFVIGLPRLLALCLARSLGFLLIRRLPEAAAEIRAAQHLVLGRGRLLAARTARRRLGPGTRRELRGLLITRRDRVRALAADLAQRLIRRRVQADAVRGTLRPDLERFPAPANGADAGAQAARSAGRLGVGPEALPAGAFGVSGSARLGVGLRRPRNALVVPVEPGDSESAAGTARPSPKPRDGSRVLGVTPDLVLVDVRPGRIIKQLMLDPPMLLMLGLAAFAVIVHAQRLGADLSGGRLLPVGSLGQVWSGYLTSWHPVHGGTLGTAPPALAVLGLLGFVLYPVGGPGAAVALLLLGDLPLAGLAAYRATRRLRVGRPARAIAAAAYALLPLAGSAVAGGRLDAAMVHILAPLALAGIAAVLRPGRWASRPGGWLPTSVSTAIGLAVIGAFSPAAALLLLLALLVGFVVVPADPGRARSRAAAMATAGLLPIALLSPWPAVLWQYPAVVLHGVGAPEAGPAGSPLDWLFLSTGGAGGAWWAGVLVVVISAVVLVLGARPAAAPGVGLAALGLLAAIVLGSVHAAPLTGGPPTAGWPGPGLFIAAAGLLWAVLTVDPDPERWRGWPRVSARWPATLRPLGAPRFGAAAGSLLLVALAGGALFAAPGGALRRGDPLVLAPTLAAELPRTGAGLLVVSARPPIVPSTLTAGRLPVYGDPDIPAAPGQRQLLDATVTDLLSDDPATVRSSVARLGSDGVAFLVLPDHTASDRVRLNAGDLIGGAPPTADGRAVLRVEAPNAAVQLLSPQLGHDARTGGSPPAEPSALGVTRVELRPPSVAVRTSSGIDGRLLVLATESEPGWRATIGNQPAPVTTAWGHQLAIPVPPVPADIRVEPPNAQRALWLLVQAAAVLFALLTVVPAPGRRPPA